MRQLHLGFEPCLLWRRHSRRGDDAAVMQFQITGRRILVGTGLSLFLLLQCVGNISRGRWSLAAGVMSGLLGVALAWTVALAARYRSAARGDFRNFVFLFLASVAAFFALFSILDTFHGPWRQYWR